MFRYGQNTTLRQTHTGNYSTFHRYWRMLFRCKILMIRDVKLWRDPGINIPHSSESNILASDVANIFHFVTDKIMRPTWKGQLRSGSLSNLEGLLSKNPGSETVSSQTLPGSFARTRSKHQGNRLHYSQDPQQGSFKPWLARVVLICEGSGKKMSYSFDKILVVCLALSQHSDTDVFILNLPDDERNESHSKRDVSSLGYSCKLTLTRVMDSSLPV